MIKRKMELTFIGYLLSLGNIYLTLNDKALPGLFLGVVSCYFFIKAIRIK